MKSFIQKGSILDLTMAATVASGAMVKIGQIFGVCLNAAASGEVNQVETEGVFELTKLGTDDVSAGDLLYFDSGNTRLTLTATSNLLVGVAVEDAGTSVSLVKVKLDGVARPDESA